MNEVMAIGGSVVGLLLLVVALVWCIARAVGRSAAQELALTQLEECMDCGNREQVRSLLICRGHLLRKDVRDNAQVWLVERDNGAPK